MARFALGVVITLLLLFLAGCGPTLHAGTVVAKDHRGAYTSTSLVMVGKTMVPTTQFHPARWWVLVENCDSLEPGCVKDRWYLDESAWRDVEVGQWLTRKP